VGALVDRRGALGRPGRVTRLTAHSSDDQQTKYRSEEELAAEKSLDPVPKFRQQLVDAGVLTPEAEERITGLIKDAVHDATEYAEAQPDPDVATAMKWVYAEDWPSETPPPWGMGEAAPHTDDAATQASAAEGAS
jgi:hypothetical protein